MIRSLASVSRLARVVIPALTSTKGKDRVYLENMP